MPPARPRPSARAAATPNVVRRDDESPMDPMDIVLGVVWAIVIPVVTYGVLFFAGLTGSGETFEESLRRNEQVRKVEPPVTYQEIDLRLARVDQILQDRVPEYVQRAGRAKDNRMKNWWQELAFRVLGVCRNELEQVQLAVPKNPELRQKPEIEQGIRRRLEHIGSQEEQIIRDNPFPDRLRAAQAEVMSKS